MGLERRISKAMFEPTEVVELRQVCFTPHRIWEAGQYMVGELPDIAFDMGLVEKLPPVRGNSADIDTISSGESS